MSSSCTGVKRAKCLPFGLSCEALLHRKYHLSVQELVSLHYFETYTLGHHSLEFLIHGSVKKLQQDNGRHNTKTLTLVKNKAPIWLCYR